jgi:hypothetical protein
MPTICQNETVHGARDTRPTRNIRRCFERATISTLDAYPISNEEVCCGDRAGVKSAGHASISDRLSAR